MNDTTPRFVAKKTGDRYQVVPVDTAQRIKLSGWAVAGGLLALYGLSRRGMTGGALAGMGGALIYCGVTGIDPLECFMSQRRERKVPTEATPSYRGDHKKRSEQLPVDDVEEASMESFPASDPPARTHVTGAGT